MTFDRTKQLQLDLIALRAQEDRLVTEAVLRKDWDHAAKLALRSQRVTEAIERMLLSGNPLPQKTWMVPAGDDQDSPAGRPPATRASAADTAR